MPSLKVLLDYHKFGYSNLETFASNLVKTGIYAHPVEFPKPPIAQADFQIELDKYSSAIKTFNAIGSSKKADLDIEKIKIVVLIDKLQDYVQNLVGLTPELVDLSGFHHSKIEQTKGVDPSQTVVEKAEAAGNGAMRLTLKADAAAFGYLAIACEVSDKEPSLVQIAESVLVPGGTSPNVIFASSSSRFLILNNLVLGKTYKVFVYTFNAKGCSPLSLPYLLVSHSN